LTIFEFVVEKASDEDSNLDIFEMILETNEPSKELVRMRVGSI
jgi:hypothetical protein